MNRLIVITGSREWVDSGRQISTIIAMADLVMHGGARGADCIAHQAALSIGTPVIVVPALWAELGRRAGLVRNAAMIALALRMRGAGFEPECHGFPMPNSRGTIHCMDVARAAGIHTIAHKPI